MNDILNYISDLLWGYPMIILLIGTHIYLTIRLKFPQRKIFTAIKLSVTKDKDGDGDVSQFGALATALAATIGTGNIIGVGTAIALGGPGAVMWCWLTGVFGIATKYSEGLLAVKYRQKSEQGHMLGGPMYVLQEGLHSRWAGMLFAIFTAIAAFGIGSTVQANAISTLARDVIGINPWVTGTIVTILVGLVLVGGIKSIARVCSALVPFMAVVYVIGCIIILCMQSAYVWPAIKLIVTSAFTEHAVGGGVLGSSIMIAARYGIARGLFSNESGLGSAPIVAASAQTKNPVRQALVSASGTFWDTVVICAITGIVIVSCILSYADVSMIDNAFLIIHHLSLSICFIKPFDSIYLSNEIRSTLQLRFMEIAIVCGIALDGSIRIIHVGISPSLSIDCEGAEIKYMKVPGSQCSNRLIHSFLSSRCGNVSVESCNSHSSIRKCSTPVGRILDTIDVVLYELIEIFGPVDSGGYKGCSRSNSGLVSIVSDMVNSGSLGNRSR